MCTPYSCYFLPLLPSAETPDSKTLLSKRQTKSSSLCCASCQLNHLILKNYFFSIERPFGKADQCKRFHVLRLKGPLACTFSSFSYFVIWRNPAKSISASPNKVYWTWRFSICTLQFYFPQCQCQWSSVRLCQTSSGSEREDRDPQPGVPHP